jgi:outer membrane lipopolysaccharide assembly protein LptE/RlpB
MNRKLSLYLLAVGSLVLAGCGWHRRPKTTWPRDDGHTFHWHYQAPQGHRVLPKVNPRVATDYNLDYRSGQ